MNPNPWYITGLVEGEGSFSVSFTLRKKLNVGIETRPSFSITLNRRDLDLLKMIHQYFQCGAIRYSKSDRCYKYEVRSVADLVKSINPHFEKYSLKGTKAKDFEIFRELCLMIHQNLHLNSDYLEKIIESAYTMNPSGKRKHEKWKLLRVLGKVKG